MNVNELRPGLVCYTTGEDMNCLPCVCRVVIDEVESTKDGDCVIKTGGIYIDAWAKDLHIDPKPLRKEAKAKRDAFHARVEAAHRAAGIK